ncbi:hypothetical protein [Amycolatopsis vancoresmycina]|uniref:Secreted protein n=1 Tax=Amycolatopsis vancoresmycina DSM 44592 TaxID=1292037 RepID=R1G9C6_9PSEU|nr:hypothetical protein [Amycolatopsis vancoresmycina]EOD67963.1 hypothetical protein H480_13710 [Amycolatopsis vancoresmycina DSM 44592]
MGRTLGRVAGIVSAGALITFAAAPAALAQTETETTTASSPSETAPGTTTATETTTPSTPVTTTATTSATATTEVTPTTTPKTTTTTTTTEASEPPKDDYQDNTGAGFVGVGGEGGLTINCAAGAPGNVATQYLNVTGGPDQDGADGRIWHYSVRVDQLPPGTITGKFSWTCAGVEGNGIVEFEQAPPPETSTSSAPTSSAPTSTVSSSTAPVTTATPAASGNAAPKAQVKVAPKGGIETGFGGTAR